MINLARTSYLAAALTKIHNVKPVRNDLTKSAYPAVAVTARLAARSDR